MSMSVSISVNISVSASVSVCDSVCMSASVNPSVNVCGAIHILRHYVLSQLRNCLCPHLDWSIM